MIGDILVSSEQDPFTVWQPRPLEQKKPSSNLYERIESKVLTVQKKLSSIVSIGRIKQSVCKSLYTMSSIIKRISEIVYEVFSNIENGTEIVIGKIPKFEDGVRILKITSLPSSLVNLVHNCYLSIYGRKSEKVDAALGTADELASIIGSLATFFIGLEGIGAITSKVSEWLGPIAVIATVFSSISILIHVRRYCKMQKIGTKLDKAVELTAKIGEAALKDYRAFLNVFEKLAEKNPEVLKDCFYYKSKVMAKRLVHIETIAQEMLASSDEQTQLEGSQLLYKTMKTLRGRIDHNKMSSVLAGVSAGTGILGSLVFFACPAMPFGLVISGIGAALGAVNFIHHRVVDYKVMKDVGLERKWYEWITC